MRKQFTKSGLTFVDVLLLVFIVLKLCGVINWSWWWVLSPIWIPLALFVGFCVAAFIVLGIEEIRERTKEKK